MVGFSGPIAPEFTGGVPNWAGPEGSPGLTGRRGGTELLAVGGVTISTGGADIGLRRRVRRPGQCLR